jgi:hypothetical protein
VICTGRLVLLGHSIQIDCGGRGRKECLERFDGKSSWKADTYLTKKEMGREIDGSQIRFDYTS